MRDWDNGWVTLVLYPSGTTHQPDAKKGRRRAAACCRRTAQHTGAHVSRRGGPHARRDTAGSHATPRAARGPGARVSGSGSPPSVVRCRCRPACILFLFLPFFFFVLALAMLHVCPLLVLRAVSLDEWTRPRASPPKKMLQQHGEYSVLNVHR